MMAAKTDPGQWAQAKHRDLSTRVRDDGTIEIVLERRLSCGSWAYGIIFPLPLLRRMQFWRAAVAYELVKARYQLTLRRAGQ